MLLTNVLSMRIVNSYSIAHVMTSIAKQITVQISEVKIDATYSVRKKPSICEDH